MKKEVLVFIFVLFASLAYAQETTQEAAVPPELPQQNSEPLEQSPAVQQSPSTESTQDVSTLLQAEPGVLPDSPVYFFDKVIDDIKLNFAGEEKKAEVAQQIHDERIAEVKALADKGHENVDDFNEALSEAEEKNEVVSEEVTPESTVQISESSRRSVGVLSEVKERVPERASEAIEEVINKQIVREKKTEIAAEITSKIDELCTKLIELVGLEAALEEEPRCNPDIAKSPKWLKRKVREDYKDFDENARKKFFEEMTRCFDDPRQCRCSEIPIKSFSNKCFKMIPFVIKCEIENEQDACARLGEEGQPDSEMFEELPQDVKEKIEEMFRKKESEGFKKHAPRECVEAGATTRQECEKIMMEKYMPSECKEAGVTTRQDCEKIMREKYGGESGGYQQIPGECKRDDKFIGVKECQRIMLEKYLPPECKEAKAYSREACESIMIRKQAPQECLVDGQFIGRERCEELMRNKGGIFGGSRPEPRPGPQNREFEIERAIGFCLEQGKTRQECEPLVKSRFGGDFLQRPTQVVTSFDKNPQVQRVTNNFQEVEQRLQGIPPECAGISAEECTAKTGKRFFEELPRGIIFKEGEAEVITSTEIQSILQESESNIQEVNIDEVRESVYTDIGSLETGSSVLEQTTTFDAASAIEITTTSSYSGGGESPGSTFSESPPTAPSESSSSGSSGGGEGSSSPSSDSGSGSSSGGDSGSSVTGSFVLDFMNRL